MSNFFTALRILRGLRNTFRLTQQQEAFLNKILEEEALTQTIKSPSASKLMHYINLLDTEINRRPHWYTSVQLKNRKYHKELKKVRAILSNWKDILERVEKPGYISSLGDDQAKSIDLIYEETVKTYKGELMLPIIQNTDKIGCDDGQCYGYFVKWAIDLLTNNTSFGINIDGKPIFDPIKLSSKVGKKYPDLNHLAHLTETIATYQFYQRIMPDFLQESPNENEKNIYISGDCFPHFYKSINQIANELIEEASEDNVKNINIYSYNFGHSLGFYFKNNKYHFFDANSGWYRFSNAEDFTRWLPFYFNAMNYNKLFLEKTIVSYSRTNFDENPTAIKIDESILKKIAHKLISSPAKLPKLTGFYGYYYGVRGLIYGLHNLENHLHDKLHLKPKTVTNSGDPAITHDAETNAPTLEYQRIDALLDISHDEIVKLEQKSATNPIFNKKLQDKNSQLVSAAKTNLFFNSEATSKKLDSKTIGENLPVTLGMHM